MKTSSYLITTEDGTGEFNFFTEAENHKKALSNLIENSNDYKNILSGNNNMTITVKKI